MTKDEEIAMDKLIDTSEVDKQRKLSDDQLRIIEEFIISWKDSSTYRKSGDLQYECILMDYEYALSILPLIKDYPMPQLSAQTDEYIRLTWVLSDLYTGISLAIFRTMCQYHIYYPFFDTFEMQDIKYVMGKLPMAVTDFFEEIEEYRNLSNWKRWRKYSHCEIY